MHETAKRKKTDYLTPALLALTMTGGLFVAFGSVMFDSNHGKALVAIAVLMFGAAIGLRLRKAWAYYLSMALAIVLWGITIFLFVLDGNIGFFVPFALSVMLSYGIYGGGGWRHSVIAPGSSSASSASQ